MSLNGVRLVVLKQQLVFKKSSLILVLNTERNALVHIGFERIWDKTVLANFESLSQSLPGRTAHNCMNQRTKIRDRDTLQTSMHRFCHPSRQ